MRRTQLKLFMPLIGVAFRILKEKIHAYDNFFGGFIVFSRIF